MPADRPEVTLRRVQEADIDVFFAFMQDPDAVAMAAFTAEDPRNRQAFDAHWNRILASDAVTMRTVMWQDEVAGNVGSYSVDGTREVTFWIGRAFWGSGIATEALRRFLDIDTTRPIRARLVVDNVGSIRVLEKCGFATTTRDEGFAHGRAGIVSEYVMALDDRNSGTPA